MAISNAIISVGEGVREVYLPLAPVPAARPRISRWGTYYPKTYSTWMKDAAALLAPHAANFAAWECPVFVMVTSSVKRPANPANNMPHPDVDNYAKAALDAVQKCGFLIKDDKQVQVLLSSKRFTVGDEAPHSYIVIADSIDGLTDRLIKADGGMGDDVYDLPEEFRVPIELFDGDFEQEE